MGTRCATLAHFSGANSVELRRAGKWKIDETWRELDSAPANGANGANGAGGETYSVISERKFDIAAPALAFVKGKWRATLVLPLPDEVKGSKSAVKTVECWATWNGADKKVQIWTRFPPAKE